MEIYFNPNGADIKVTWKTSVPGAGPSGPFSADSETVRIYSNNVRAGLNVLNEYFRNENRKHGDYRAIMRDLYKAGRLLRSALIDEGTPEETALEFKACLRSLSIDETVTVYIQNTGVAIPLGFICEETPIVFGPIPSRLDFNGFWINRLKLAVRITGRNCPPSVAIDPKAFRVIFALHSRFMEHVLAELTQLGLEKERQQFEYLTSIDQGDHYTWESVRTGCEKMNDAPAVYFIFAHSEGRTLQFDDDENNGGGAKSWIYLKTILNERSIDKTGLIIFNCCSSAAGGQKDSLLTIVNQKGFCGMVGTEAEVRNTASFRCGLRLMWELCVEQKTLGDAFTAMQEDEELFPVNLFYTCYAARNFRLNGPINFPIVKELT